MKLASIEQIKLVEKHPNADSLDLVQVLNYKCIVKLGQYKVGDIVVFIQPDTVLPDAPWAAFYKSKSNRVKAIRLRNVWSMGIVESLLTVGLENEQFEVGQEISDRIGVIKYEAPVPQDLSAKGGLPYGIPKTDEERWQNIDRLPYGKLVDITLKVDGQSETIYCKQLPDETWDTGICGRSFAYKTDAINKYTENARKHNLIEKLKAFCIKENVSLCIRGEQYGTGIQAFAKNPHSKKELGFAMFSVYIIDEHRYARLGDKYYFANVAEELNIPTVEILEKNVILTPELIKKYDEELTTINDNPFEGVVVNGDDFSFKIINKTYDSNK